ncbi:MAG: M16 family metallopeptidase [Bacteroidota bacterium]
MSLLRNRPETQTIQTFEVPESRCITLASGHQLHLSTPCSIGVVRVELFWASGSFHQSKPYVAGLANDLMFSGNENRSEYEVIEYLDYLGATHRTECGHLGSSVVLRASKKNILEAFKWSVENIEQASYPDRELESAKMVRYASLERQQKTPKYWSSRIALETLYGRDNTLGIHGNPEDYDNIHRTDLQQFKSEHYSMDRLMLFVSGDVDDALLDDFSTILSNYSGRPIEIEQHEFTGTSGKSKEAIYHRVEGTSQVNVNLDRHVKPANQRERFGLTLLNLVLGGYFGSRLMQILREEKGLTYGIGSYFKPAFNDFTWTISGDLKSENSVESLVVIHEIFTDLKSNLLSDNELTKIKQYYSGQFRGGFDGPFAMGGKYQHAMYRGLTMDYYSTVLPGIWAVTSEEIMALANNYLDPESFIHVLSGDTDKT